MKKVLLTLLTVIVIVGALAGAGFAGYRIGYNQGAVSSGNPPLLGRGEHLNPDFMPHNFGRDFGPRIQPFGMMRDGNFGIRLFSPFRLLWNIAILALVIWFVYWLITKSGWHLTRQVNVDQRTSSAKTEE